MGKVIPYWDNHAIVNDELVKKCYMCLNWFPCDEEYFYKNKKNKSDGVYPYCITCHKNKSYKRILENPDKHSEYMKKETSKPHIKSALSESSRLRRENGKYKEWQQSDSGKESYKKSRQKREIKKHEITEDELKQLYDYCNSECMYCGLPEVENIRLHNRKFSKDHAINTGSNGIDNCILCCTSCSSSKHAKDWTQWYTTDNRHYTQERFEAIQEWLINSDKYIKSIVYI